MPNFQITTITPVHIGSGDMLQGNYEFLYFSEDNEIALIDDKKILDLIQEENIGHWVSTVENGESLLSYLQGRFGKLKACDVANQVLKVTGEAKLQMSGNKTTTLRGQLKSLDNSIIAGSSLKGSIRTALLSYFINQDPDIRFYQNNFNLTNRNQKFSDEKVIRKHFGNDPNHDILRLLQVGDATFNGSNICLYTSTINLYNSRKWEFKKEIDQYIECLPTGANAEVRLKFNRLLFEQAQWRALKSKVSYGNRDETYRLFDSKQPEFLQFGKLFPIINGHTSRVIGNELSFWNKRKEEYPPEIDEYIEQLKIILNQITKISSEEQTCILRLGWGSGFRNMTGDWQEDMMTEKDLDALIKELRPKHDVNLTFPKTRRMASDGTPLGFVKLVLEK